MVFELLRRLVLLTSGTAALVWGVASMLESASVYPAAAAFCIASATFLLTPYCVDASSLADTNQPVARKKESSTTPKVWGAQLPAIIFALILWVAAAISLAYTVFQTNITMEELGFFSTRALLLCWLCVVPLFFTRIRHRARRIESSKSNIADPTSDPS